MNFTFECVTFEPDHLVLQFEFVDPDFISNYGIDRITIRVLDNRFFRSKERIKVKRDLKEDKGDGYLLYVPSNYLMVHSIPKQLTTGERTKE